MRMKSCCIKNSYQAMLKKNHSVYACSLGSCGMQFQHETVHCMYNNYSIRSIECNLENHMHASEVFKDDQNCTSPKDA